MFSSWSEIKFLSKLASYFQVEAKSDVLPKLVSCFQVEAKSNFYLNLPLVFKLKRNQVFYLNLPLVFKLKRNQIFYLNLPLIFKVRKHYIWKERKSGCTQLQEFISGRLLSCLIRTSRFSLFNPNLGEFCRGPFWGVDYSLFNTR